MFLRSALSGQLAMWVSHPVCMKTDGSNNEAQHLSAIEKDYRGASTNLVPHDTPKDIYQDVADGVIKVLENRKAYDVMAQQWLEFGVSRKTTKRPSWLYRMGARYIVRSNI